MLARLKRFSFISIPNDRQFVKRVSEKILMDLAILRGICSLQAEKTFFHGILGGRAAWRRVCGRAKLLAGTLRCLRLCWRLPWDWSDEEQLGQSPKPHKGQTKRDEVPLDPARGRRKGTKSPLDPLRAIGLVALSCSFRVQLLMLRLSPCLLPQLSVKNQMNLEIIPLLPESSAPRYCGGSFPPAAA